MVANQEAAGAKIAASAMNEPADRAPEAATSPEISPPTAALLPGDRAPNFSLPDQQDKMRPFYERTLGNPLALLLDPEAAMLAAYAAAGVAFAERGLDILALVPGPVARAAALAAETGAAFPLLADPLGKILAGYRAAAKLPADARATLLLDANQRLVAIALGAAGGPDWARDLAATARAAETGIGIAAPAPILVAPALLDRATCRRLIERWERLGAEEGHVASVIEGQQVRHVNDALKRRRDHVIRDADTTRALAETIGRRLAPELAKAFNFNEGFRFENFRVGCYDAARGDYFRRHRDSQGARNDNRRFAISLNLNSEEFEGGEVWFPEYGPHRYKPPTGGGLVFSCMLAHEALPVTRGRRFALFSFLLDPKMASPTAVQRSY
jgi:predicted 2-oxoglutarate/Fe(II)-dependent dioxygenase YbiX/peroxiredoxin